MNKGVFLVVKFTGVIFLKKNVKIYAVAILIPLAVGALSAFFTMGNMSIYTEINTPPLSPPGFLFPIVWTVLYILMGISSAVVYINRAVDIESAKSGLLYYAASLGVNFFWSIIFFNFRLFLFAASWLLLLLYLILQTVYFYKKVSPVAAYLQIPYILWVSFAGYLTIAIYLLNK